LYVAPRSHLSAAGVKHHMDWLKLTRTMLTRGVATLSIAAGLLSLSVQGGGPVGVLVVTLALLGVTSALVVAVVAAVLSRWRTMAWGLIAASLCVMFVVAVLALGRLVFHASRLVVQDASAALVPRLDAYRHSHGYYPEELSELSVDEPHLGWAVAKYSRAISSGVTPRACIKARSR